MIKYGFDNFRFSIIEDKIIDQKLLCQREEFHIKDRNTLCPIGYNVRENSNDNGFGKTYEQIYGEERSEKIKKKLSMSVSKQLFKQHHFRGKKLSEEHRKKLSKAKIGKTLEERLGASGAEKWRKIVKERMSGDSNPIAKLFDEKSIKDIRYKFDNGMRIQVIAREYRSHPQTIKKQLIKSGLSIEEVQRKVKSKRSMTEEHINKVRESKLRKNG